MRTVKKILIWVLLVAVFTGVIVGGVVGYSYYKTDADGFAAPVITADGLSLPLNGYDWNEPVMGGILFKKSSEAPKALLIEPLSQEDFAQTSITFAMPDAFPVHLVVRDEAQNVIFDCNNKETAAVDFPANGLYTIEADVTVPRHLPTDHPGAPAHGHGTFHYTAQLRVNAPPKLEFSSVKVLQGDVVTVRLSGFLEDPDPVIETDLGLAQFCPVPGGKAAVIGIHYNREPGVWPVRVKCGKLDVTQEITVVHRDFPKQNVAAAAEPSDAKAEEEWRNAIYPLYGKAEPEFYWSGTFVRPCDSEAQLAAYGLFRYYGDSKRPVRSAGIDYACAAGEEVRSPAHGTVVFADFLQLTGNTVVVSHGGGLKSYFFYLDSITCKRGDAVKAKQAIGTAGQSGLTSGPRLHYEARIGNQSIDPELLFNGHSGLYAAQ